MSAYDPKRTFGPWGLLPRKMAAGYFAGHKSLL